MPVRSNIEKKIISIIRDVSGRNDIRPWQMISKDIGVHGWDGVILAEEVEKVFKIDLEPFIQSHTKFSKPGWFDRLLGRNHGPPNADATVDELTDYVFEFLQRNSGDTIPN